MSDTKPRCPRDWEQAYVDGRVPWDLGSAPPALEALVARTPPGRVFVPGAGRGHDARAWARGGSAVTALDVSPTAVAEARALDAASGAVVTWIAGDLFDLPRDLAGAFDVVWEQTCFCALAPEQRDAYVDAVADVLAPGGRFHGILWNTGQPGGPPYAVTGEDIDRHLGRRFEILAVTPIEPWTDARWDEVLVSARLAS